MMKRKTRCLRQTATDRVEAVIPKMFDPDEMTMTDVEFQLEEGPNIRAHKFILCSSPVLKAALSNIDVRLCPIPVISLHGFHRESVQNLLHFLYKGVVDMVWGSEIHTDFMKLCKALRVNPRSVKRTGGPSQEPNPPSGNEADDAEANGEAAEAATNVEDNEVATNVENNEEMVEEEEGASSETQVVDLSEKMDVVEKEIVANESSNRIEEIVENEPSNSSKNIVEDESFNSSKKTVEDESSNSSKKIVEDDSSNSSKEIVEKKSSNGDEDVKENDIIGDTKEDIENKAQEEERSLKSGDQAELEDNLREENNNLALDLVNIDELGLDTSSDNAMDEKHLNYDSVSNDEHLNDSVSNDEPDGANVKDAVCSDPVIEGETSGANVVIDKNNVIIQEKSDSSDERTREMKGAGDKRENFIEKDSVNDIVNPDSLEGVKPGTTEICKSKPERYVCDICVEVFGASKDLEEHKQTVHLIDEISDDDTQEETTEAIFDFLSKDLGVICQEEKRQPETSQNVPEKCQIAVTETTNEDLSIRIENVTSLEEDKLDEPFSLGEINGTSANDDIPDTSYESEPFEFKMPDSFDLSVDYIKEIVPASKKVQYLGSDEENEDAIGFIGLNKLEFKIPLSDLSSEIKEELDNQPVPDENPSLDVIPAESSSSLHRSETPESVEAITYKKDKSSKSSMRSREKPLQSKRDRKKKDRKLMNSLFGSDEVVSEGSSNKKERHSSPSKVSWPAKKERKEGKSSNKERSADEERKTMTPSPEGRTSSPTRTPTPTMSISEELKEKRERMMRKMKCDTEEKLDEKLEAKDYKEMKRRRKKESSPRKRGAGTPTKAPSHHGTHHKGCNSSCRIDHRWSDDESWLVPDDYESSSESDVLSDHKAKTEKKEESKAKIKVKSKPVEEVKSEQSSDDDDFIDDEDEEDEDEEAKRNRKKRLAERKKKAGGDVLFWMNPGHKSKVRVSVQMFAKEDIMDMNYYKMKLLADEGSDTDVETSKKVSDSDVSSVSSKRSKSPDYVKRMLDSDTDNSQVKRKKHKKKRKKKKRHSSNGSPSSSEKYKRPVSDSSDEDIKPKSKQPKFHRSVSHVSSFGESSKRSNSFTKPVIQRSFSTLESLGISHNYGLSGEAKSVSSMPKIPKIVKPSTEMPKIPKIEKSTTEMPKIPKFAKIPKIL